MSEKVKVLGEGKFIRLVSADGWEYAERRNVTGIVTIAAEVEGRIVLVEQFRPALQANVIELPAGLAGDVAESEDEELLVAAQRELEEETGYRAEHWEEVFAGPLSAGMTTEVVTFFRASGLKRVGKGGGEGSEEITVHEVPVAEAPGWLKEQERRGRLVDPKVYAGLYVLTPYRQ